MMLPDGVVEDLQAKPTDKLLLKAFIELTAQKGFAALTVTDLVKYAGVNRATFYRHFEDKFDLLNDYARTVYDLLISMPDAVSPMSAELAVSPPELVAVFNHIRANARFYRLMLADPRFADQIRHYIRQRIWRSLPATLQKENSALDLYLSYSSSASFAAVLWWLDHDMPYSVGEMAAISYRVSMTLSTMLAQPLQNDA